MPARAIIDLPKMPESCSKCDEAGKTEGKRGVKNGR